MNNTLLIAEDDKIVAKVLAQKFSNAGFVTHIVEQGDQVERAIYKYHPDCIILDIGLPVLDGYEVLERIKSTFDGSIIFYTSHESDMNEINALQKGVDDIVFKSKDSQILIERVKRLTGALPQTVETHRLTINGLNLNGKNQWCQLNEQSINLSESEFEILFYLAQHHDKVITREQFYLAIKGVAYDGKSRSFDLNVSRIKDKLVKAGANKTLIKSIRGKGYILLSEEC
jgi:two-component system response regulator RstA